MSADASFDGGQLVDRVTDLARTAVITTAAGGSVTGGDLREWVYALYGTVGNVVDVYIGMICHYVNSQATPPGQAQVTDVVCQPHDFYLDLLIKPDGYVRASQRLRNAGITVTMMQQARYFFIPIYYHGHVCLVVVSPRDLTIELLDSCGRVREIVKNGGVQPKSINKILALVLRWAQHEFGPNFNSADWVTAHGQVPKQDVTQQPDILADGINCGSFACQFAMSIACREPLQHDTYEWLINGRAIPHSRDRVYERCRIAAEILHGDFSAPFDTHPIQPHPGADRRQNLPWTPVPSQPELLRARTRIGSDSARTAAAKRRGDRPPRKTELKSVLASFCKDYPKIVTSRGPVAAFAGYTKMMSRKKKGARMPSYHKFLEWIEDRLDDITHGNYP